MFFNMDYSQVEDLQKAMEEYGEGSLRTINEVIHGEGAEEIKRNIQMILPASGRHWKGKKAAARSTQPFTEQKQQLSVTVKSKKPYNYLYFPDDGSNTIHHAGNQQFMLKGAERSTDKIIKICLGKLAEKF